VRAAASPTNDGAHGVTRPTRATAGEVAKLRARLAVAEETLRAIRSGEVDSVMVAGKEGSQVFTLEGAEHAYRVLIESMNEGALTLTADRTILYANQCFARMVKCPLELVMGSCFRRFLSAADRTTLLPLMKRADKSGSKIPVLLHAGDGSKMPVQISIRPLARDGFNHPTFGLVVTDMTEARHNEERLRTLTHRVVQAQEAERGRVAFELHDHITQLLCAVLVRCQTLATQLSARDGPAMREAIKLRELLGQTAGEVERISRHLRPSVLDELGLVAVVRDTSTEFAERTGVCVKLACAKLTARLPADTELTLYRILQEALRNVEQHARARHVTVCLRLRTFVQLAIRDDGIGFDPEQHAARRKRKGGLGLLSMRERATYVGGEFKIKSVRGAGTEIEVRIPLPPKVTAAKSHDEISSSFSSSSSSSNPAKNRGRGRRGGGTGTQVLKQALPKLTL
jgi:two-component system, NarL family, sensor kinase